MGKPSTPLNKSQYELELAGARAEYSSFNPDLHPRNPHGEFMKSFMGKTVTLNESWTEGKTGTVRSLDHERPGHVWVYWSGLHGTHTSEPVEKLKVHGKIATPKTKPGTLPNLGPPTLSEHRAKIDAEIAAEDAWNKAQEARMAEEYDPYDPWARSDELYEQAGDR